MIRKPIPYLSLLSLLFWFLFVLKVWFKVWFKVGSQDTQIVVFGEGDHEPAFGLFGGYDGTLNSIRLIRPDGEEIVPLNKDLIADVPKGTIYHQMAGGGGGYGDPKLRSREIVAQEVRNGILSADAARRNYGVEIEDG